MQSKLNRMMASSKRHMPAQIPTKDKRSLKILDNTKPLLDAPVSEDWQLVMVEPRCELKAALWLREAGFYAWHPQITAWVNCARMRIKTKVNRPVFPGYIFVSAVDGARKSLRGYGHVNKVVGPVPTEGSQDRNLIAALSKRQASGEFDATRQLLAGDKIQIVDDGPFRELKGIVMKSDIERTTILLKIMGSQQKISMETDSLQKVA